MAAAAAAALKGRMETAGWQDSPGGVLDQRHNKNSLKERKMATKASRIGIDGPILARENKAEVVKKVTAFSWRPKKGLTEDMVDKLINTLDDYKDLESDAEDCELDDDSDDSMLLDTDFPEIKTISHYEKEDWDKELADCEYNNKPYDLDDIIYCENFQDQAPIASCSLQGKLLYNPSSHHVAPLTWGQLETMTVDGQFDDAVD